MICTHGTTTGSTWRCGTCEHRFPDRSGGTSATNSNSLALNISRESTMKFGRSGVGREVPPLRSGNQVGFNSLVAHHVNRANLIQDRELRFNDRRSALNFDAIQSRSTCLAALVWHPSAHAYSARHIGPVALGLKHKGCSPKATPLVGFVL